MMQDHQYNNPVSAVFFQILLHELSRSRALRARLKFRITIKLLVL